MLISDEALMGLSGIVLAIAATQAAVLVRGSEGLERRLWQALTLAILVGAAGRVVNLISLTRTDVDLPFWVSVTMLTNPAMVAVVLALIRPRLRTYRRADELRRASDEAFRRSFTASRDPLGIIDATGRYIDVNDAGLAFFRYRREEIVGQPFRAFLVGDADPRGTVEQAVRSGVDRVERDILRGDGTRVSVECDLISLGSGRILIVGRDLAARRAAEADRLRVERLSAIGELADSVGADLRELLSFVKSSLELSDELGRDRVTLDAPIAAAAEALQLVDQFAAVGRDSVPETPDWEAVPLRPTLEDVVAESQRDLEGRVDVALDPVPAGLVVRVPAHALRHIVSAVVLHAVAAALESTHLTPPGRLSRTHVEVSARAAEGDPHGAVEILVEDDARTLDATLRSTMFEPLGPATAPRRPGLGATHALVLQLGGALLLERNADGGRVLVRLPGGSGAAAVAAAEGVPARPSL